MSPRKASPETAPAQQPATCATCPFWVLQREEWGKCRRYPPTVLVAAQSWPQTAQSAWCGEHPGRREAAP